MNLPAPILPIKIAKGSIMRRTFGIASGPGNVNSLIGIGTLAKRMMISLNSDEYAIPNP